MGGVTGVASEGSCWKLPLCPTELMSAASKMDLLLAKAELISNGGNASVITFLRRKKVAGTDRNGSRRESENM